MNHEVVISWPGPYTGFPRGSDQCGNPNPRSPRLLRAAHERSGQRCSAKEFIVTIIPDRVYLTPTQFDALAQTHVDGRATTAEVATLETNQEAWIGSLWRLLDQAEETLASARRTVKGAARGSVLGDLDEECFRIDAVITSLTGAPEESELLPLAVEPPAGMEDEPETYIGSVQLQLSRTDGCIVAWAAGHNLRGEFHGAVLERVRQLGGGAIEWDAQATMKTPGTGRVSTLSVPLAQVLGWLVALKDTADDESVGPSVTWMGHAAALAVELVAQGRVVPQLIQSKRRRRDPVTPNHSSFRVRWVPALIDESRLAALVASVPGAAMAASREQERRKFTMAALTDLTDAIVGISASQIEMPAAPPLIETRADLGEATLCHLDGTNFQAPTKTGSELLQRLTQWGQSVIGPAEHRLVVQLDPPDDAGAWLVAILAVSDDGHLEPIEVALTTTSKGRAKHTAAQLARLERLFPELLRLGGRRRGEVILSQDEAWRLMTTSGDTLSACGFDVRVPALKRRRAVASLRLTSESNETVVGAQQLADVRWSAVFEDVELTASEISKLSAEARPLVKSRGKWIEIDKADLAEAASALADRADQNKLSGADMLRHALGLEGSPFAGGVSIVGDGWAADILRSVEAIPKVPTTTPEGFEGVLRSYQADALAWLTFLDNAGLGGCLALDMGLGKTPTTLANIARTTQNGTALVIAPPAVVGNWAGEAARFVPGVRVLVHHGANRAKGPALGTAVRAADLVITTYGTAVRDMDQLSELSFGKVVIDEAQAIKNPAAETSQQLRRINARSRIALTGTPIENGLGDLWAIMDWANPGLLGPRAPFISQLTPDHKSRSGDGEAALRALNGILIHRRTKAEPSIAAELPDRIDELDHCAMTNEQIGLYQAVIDTLITQTTKAEPGTPARKGAVLAAITALKQICNHPLNYQADDRGVAGRSGKLTRLNEIIETVFATDEKVLVFTHFASWGIRLAEYLSDRTGTKISCYHGSLSRGARDALVEEFESTKGAGVMVLSLKAGGTGLNLTAANHVVLYDRWWNPAVEDQARDRVWRIGQKNTVICHRLICPGTIDERVEEIVAGKRQIADLTLPRSKSIGDLDAGQLQQALGIDVTQLLDVDDELSAGEVTS